MEGIFATLATTFVAYKYPLLFIGSIFEGPIVMVASGVLLHLPNFYLLPIYFTLLFGDLTADILWYTVGRNLAAPLVAKYGYIFGVSVERFEKMKTVFRRHDFKILFISKITMGFGFAIGTIAAAGAAHVPFKKFVVFNLLGGFIWTSMLIALGYFLGQLYGVIADGFKLMFIFASCVILISMLYGFMSFVKSKYKF